MKTGHLQLLYRVPEQNFFTVFKRQPFKQICAIIRIPKATPIQLNVAKETDTNKQYVNLKTIVLASLWVHSRLRYTRIISLTVNSLTST